MENTLLKSSLFTELSASEQQNLSGGRKKENSSKKSKSINIAIIIQNNDLGDVLGASTEDVSGSGNTLDTSVSQTNNATINQVSGA